MRIVTPTHYTLRDGGHWIEWTFGEILDFPEVPPKTTLARFRVREEPTLPRLKGKPFVASEIIVIVHSIAIKPIGKGYGHFPRWDSMNGWTKNITED